MKPLSRDTILDAFAALSDELPSGNGPEELIIVGGAALVLLYDARAATQDVDAAVAGSSVVDASRRIADRLGLPRDWLNDAAKGYLQGLAAGETVFSSDSLTVMTVAPPQLLAMKLSAWRDDLDIEDARLLLSRLEGDQAEVWALVEPHLVPGRELKARYAFEDLWEALHGHS